MRRGRPPRPLGVPGKPMLTEIAPGHWKLRIYVRDSSGRRRDVTRFSPIKLNTQGRALPDRTGQRALDAVLSAAADIGVDLDDALSDSITVRELWKHHRDHLISPNRSGATISRYDEATQTFDTAFGGRRLFEVTTSTVEAFLQEVGHARGPSNMPDSYPGLAHRTLPVPGRAGDPARHPCGLMSTDHPRGYGPTTCWRSTPATPRDRPSPRMRGRQRGQDRRGVIGRTIPAGTGPTCSPRR